MIDKIKNLFNLYFSFAKIGTFTIGGGLAMIPMMQSELIEKRKWITDEELIDYYAVGQSTPGIVAVNVATFVGYKQMGIVGGIFATLGMVTPSLVIIMILASLINSINDFPIIQKALKGINVAVAALLTSTIINFMKKTIKKFTNAIFMMISFLLVFVFKLPSFWIILFALLIGVVLTYKEKKKVASVEEDSKKIDGEEK